MKPQHQIEIAIRMVLNLGTATLTELSEAFTLYSVTSGASLSCQGEVDEMEYLLLSGRARSIVRDADGREVTLGLFDGPMILPPNMARTSKGLSLVDIEMLDDVIVAKLSTRKLMEKMVQSTEIRDWGNQVMQNELTAKVEREWCLAALPARERLDWFRMNYVGFETRFSHAFIASFLGMTPVRSEERRVGKEC